MPMVTLKRAIIEIDNFLGETFKKCENAKSHSPNRYVKFTFA